MSPAPWISIVLNYVCPSVGCVLSSVMFAAPILDLRNAMKKGKLDMLNPVPWAVMTGNCLGWCAYGYYKHDPFLLASNLPGLILSLWLNHGGAKLQYHEMYEELKESNSSLETIITTSQERLLLRILIAWSVVLVYVGWIQTNLDPAPIIGIIVNINLVFFYGAPLQAMHNVITTRNSAAIHVPTMVLNWVNTSFWMAYGFARNDPIIYGPNGIGLLLGILQGVLVCLYPRHMSVSQEEGSVALVEDDHQDEAAENLVV